MTGQEIFRVLATRGAPMIQRLDLHSLNKYIPNELLSGRLENIYRYQLIGVAHSTARSVV